MRQVNPNKASKEKTKLMLPNNKTTHEKSQSFETSHATAKITNHTIKMTSSMA
jgi:hypothetical protein